MKTALEQLDRMDALVKKIARSDLCGTLAEAQAILAEREPVDPDVRIAQQICDRSPYDLNGLTLRRMEINNAHIREAVLAGIKYGRAQQ